MEVLGYNEIVDVITQKGYSVIIFCLGDEFPQLNDGKFWLLGYDNVYLGRCDLEEFKMLDIGVHPKTIIFQNGRELQSFNGIPSRSQVSLKYLVKVADSYEE